MNTVYFQPKGIKPQYCEVGMIHESVLKKIKNIINKFFYSK